MIEILAIVVPVAITGIGGYIHMWTKVATNDANIAGLRELINSRFDNIDEKFEDSNYRLQRIEKAMNGHLKDV